MKTKEVLSYAFILVFVLYCVVRIESGNNKLETLVKSVRIVRFDTAAVSHAITGDSYSGIPATNGD